MNIKRKELIQKNFNKRKKININLKIVMNSSINFILIQYFLN